MKQAAGTSVGMQLRNRLIPAIFAVAALVAADPALAQDEQQQLVTAAGLTTLLTDTPEEGFALAVRLSQKAVGMTQTDASVRSVLRPAYAHDPNSLIAVSQVVATHFQTIAAANNYWRE
jgi:hypothetical protein